MAARYSETKLTDQYSLLYSGQLLEGELLDMKKRIEEELASIRPISYGFSREEDYYGAEGSGPAYTMADVIKMNPLQKAAKEIKRQLLSHKTRKQPSSSGVQRHASTSRVNWDQSPKLSYFTRSSSNSATERDTSTSSESDESWIEDDSPTLSPKEQAPTTSYPRKDIPVKGCVYDSNEESSENELEQMSSIRNKRTLSTSEDSDESWIDSDYFKPSSIKTAKTRRYSSSGMSQQSKPHSFTHQSKCSTMHSASSSKLPRRRGDDSNDKSDEDFKPTSRKRMRIFGSTEYYSLREKFTKYLQTRKKSRLSKTGTGCTSARETSSERESSPQYSRKRPNIDYDAHKNVVALDCEIVSCRPTAKWFQNAVPKFGKGKATEVSVAAQCAIVGYDYKVLYNSYIRSDLQITNWRGMAPSDLESATPFEKAREQILHQLKDKLVVANDIRHDLSALQIHRGRDILSSNIRDTSTCELLRRKANVPTELPNASLRALVKGILNRNIHKKGPHDPVKDATDAMELYHTVEEEWERQITGNVNSTSDSEDLL